MFQQAQRDRMPGRLRPLWATGLAGLLLGSGGCGGRTDGGKSDLKAGAAASRSALVVDAQAPPSPEKSGRPTFSTAYYIESPKVKTEGEDIKVLLRIFHNPSRPVALGTVCLNLLDRKSTKIDFSYDDAQSIPRGKSGDAIVDNSVEPGPMARGVAVEAFIAEGTAAQGCDHPDKLRSNVASSQVGKPGSATNLGKEEGDAKSQPFVIEGLEAEYVPYDFQGTKNFTLRAVAKVRHRGDQPVQVPGGCVVAKDADGFDIGTFELEEIEMASGGEAEIRGQATLDAAKVASATKFVAYVSNYKCGDKPAEAVSNVLTFAKGPPP